MYINYLEYKYKNSILNEINEYKNLDLKIKKKNKNLKNFKKKKKLKKINVFNKLFKKNDYYSFDDNEFFLNKPKELTLNFKIWKKLLEKRLKVDTWISELNVLTNIKVLKEKFKIKNLDFHFENSDIKNLKNPCILEDYKNMYLDLFYIFRKSKINYRNFIIKKILKKSKWKIFNFFLK